MKRDGYERRDPLVAQRSSNAYSRSIKLTATHRCNNCGLLYVNRRWPWKTVASEAPENAGRICKYLRTFPQSHRTEIVTLIRNEEAREKANYPLERIMCLSDTENEVLITTTGVHIGRRFGEALFRSFKGNLALQYREGGECIRVSWNRSLPSY